MAVTKSGPDCLMRPNVTMWRLSPQALRLHAWSRRSSAPTGRRPSVRSTSKRSWSGNCENSSSPSLLVCRRGEINGQRRPRGRSLVETSWKPQPARNQSHAPASESPKPVFAAQIGIRSTRDMPRGVMVRKGSTVRVRQRALPANRGVFTDVRQRISARHVHIPSTPVHIPGTGRARHHTNRLQIRAFGRLVTPSLQVNGRARPVSLVDGTGKEWAMDSTAKITSKGQVTIPSVFATRSSSTRAMSCSSALNEAGQ